MTTVKESIDLEQRLTDLLGRHIVDPEDRARITAAYRDAGMDTAGWSDLPADVQQLVEQLEKTAPQQYWDDPLAVPENPEG